MERICALLLLALVPEGAWAQAYVAPPPASLQTPPAAVARADQEELQLLARSLRPEGRAELTTQLGPLEELPIVEVQAQLDPAAARIEGELRLVYTNREAAPLRELVLRLYPQAHGRAARTSLSVAGVRIDGVAATSRVHGSVLEVRLARPLAKGAACALTLSFHGRLRRLGRDEDDPLAQGQKLLAALAPGLGALGGRGGGTGQQGIGGARPEQGYGTFAVSDLGATLVDWYPQLAARAKGRWDRREPGSLGDAARADIGSALVSLTVPKGFHVEGAGAALGQHPDQDGRETASFAMAGVRGSLGLIASPSSTLASTDVDGVHLRASSLNGSAGAQALLSCAKDALSALQRRFGSYPWTNLAIAEMPLTGGAGGVELPGLALIAQALSPDAPPAPGIPAGIFQFTCAHEVAHQWWQGLVGSDPRGAPWVDEALAQFSAVLAIEAAAGGGEAGRAAGEAAQAQFIALNYRGMRMTGIPDGTVARPADSFASPTEYAGLIYGKAPLFFAAVRALLGDPGFDSAARAYRKEFAFKDAGSDGFLAAAQRTNPAKSVQLAALAHRWLHEKHGDEDVRQIDSASLLGALGGGMPSVAALSGLVRQLQQLQGAAGGLNGPGGGGPDDATLRDALRQLEKTMPGLTQMLQQNSDANSNADLNSGADGGDDDQP